MGCKGILKKRQKSCEIIKKYKAHLITKIFRQRWYRFFETFSPFVRLTYTSIIISHIVIHIVKAHKTYVKNVFLDCDMEEKNLYVTT